MLEYLITQPEFYLAIVIVIVVPLALRFDKQQRQSRLRKLKLAGFSETSREKMEQWANLPAFRILNQQGIFSKTHEHFRGEHEGHNIGLFQLSIADGSKAGQHQTVAVIELRKSLPAFILRPEGLTDKIASKLGGEDIDFPTHPDFSNNYHLQGASESTLRATFNDSVIAFFQDNHSLWLNVTARGSWCSGIETSCGVERILKSFWTGSSTYKTF